MNAALKQKEDMRKARAAQALLLQQQKVKQEHEQEQEHEQGQERSISLHNESSSSSSSSVRSAEPTLRRFGGSTAAPPSEPASVRSIGFSGYDASREPFDLFGPDRNASRDTVGTAAAAAAGKRVSEPISFERSLQHGGPSTAAKRASNEDDEEEEEQKMPTRPQQQLQRRAPGVDTAPGTYARLPLDASVVNQTVAVVQTDVGQAADFGAIADALGRGASVGGRASTATPRKPPSKSSSGSSGSSSRAKSRSRKTPKELAMQQMSAITAVLDDTSQAWLDVFKQRLEAVIAANDAASIQDTIAEDAAHFEQDPGVHRILLANTQLRDEMTARLERVAKIRMRQAAVEESL